MSKKSFIDNINPAMQFITPQQQEDPEAAPADSAQVHGKELTPPQGYKVDPRFIETRSKHVQLLVQPSLHKRVKALAKQQKRSVNDMLNALIEAALEVEEAKS